MHTDLNPDIIYINLSEPGGLGSISKLKQAGVKNPRRYLNSKDSYTLHKVTKKRFKRRPFITAGPGKLICCDVAYLKNYEKSNDGNGYLLVFIDVFSRYLTVYMLKSLKSKDIIPKMDDFFSNSIYKYTKMITDEGIEFTSNASVQLLNKLKVCRYHTYNREIKASHAERVIKTLKMKISRFITEFNSERYIDDLSKIVDTYNHTSHRGLAYKTPIDIHLITKWGDIVSSFKDSYKYKNRIKSKSLSNVLRPGVHVRLVAVETTQNRFVKESNIRNTREIFQIEKLKKTHPVTYSLRDLENKKIEGSFYRDELIPVENSGNYRIKILKTRKRLGEIEYLVTYIDYPESKSEWVKSLELKELPR